MKSLFAPLLLSLSVVATSAVAAPQLPAGYVPAPTGKGWSEGPALWREFDHAGQRVVRCLQGPQDAKFKAAPTGKLNSCKDSQRVFQGATVANGSSIVQDEAGNRWDVHVSDKIERWTDAHGNVTTCKYEAGFKSCKFPEPQTIKVSHAGGAGSVRYVVGND